MADRYFNLGNSVVSLAALVDGNTPDDSIIEYAPLILDINGQLQTITRYPLLGAPSTLAQPLIVDVSDNITVASGDYGFLTGSVEYLVNDQAGTQLERKRNNQTLTMLTSAVRSSTTASGNFTNHNSRGGHFVIDISDIETDATLTPTIQGNDELTDEYYDILTGLEITTAGTHVIKVYPGIGQIPNGAASDILPRLFRINMVYGGTDDITYSVSCALIM